MLFERLSVLLPVGKCSLMIPSASLEDSCKQQYKHTESTNTQKRCGESLLQLVSVAGRRKREDCVTEQEQKNTDTINMTNNSLI